MRYRWLKAEFKGVGFDIIKKCCQESPYDELSEQGFRLEVVRDNFMQGKYIVKKEIEENTTDPFGNMIKNKRIIFETHKFKLSRDFPEIILINPTRSVQEFFTKLAVMSDFSIFISKISLNILTWLRQLEKEEGLEFIVRQLSCSGISLSPTASGKLSISGSEDVRQYLSEMAGNKKFVIDKARLTIRYLDEKHECQISRQGNINILSGKDDDVLGVLINSLNC